MSLKRISTTCCATIYPHLTNKTKDPKLLKATGLPYTNTQHPECFCTEAPPELVEGQSERKNVSKGVVNP